MIYCPSCKSMVEAPCKVPAMCKQRLPLTTTTQQSGSVTHWIEVRLPNGAKLRAKRKRRF